MNKLKFPLLFLFASSILNSQDLDDSFLASLPVDLRKDVVERAENQDSSTEENYTPYKYSSKLQRAEELIDLKNRLESDLEELERRLNSDEKLDIDKELKLFGESFFSTFQTSFMPINEPNPDSSYTLDVGDVLNIQLIGQQNYNKNFAIKGSGAINLDNIGEIIGKGGSTIKDIIEKSGAKIDISDNGNVKIAGTNNESIEAAKELINSIIEEPEVGQVYEGKVVKVMDFGAFVNFFGKRDGLVHISQLSDERVEKVTDVINEGDIVKVKVIGFDKGKVKLSIKDAEN